MAFLDNDCDDSLQQTVLQLSQDIGSMADRIGDMADRIGEMSDRILETQRIQSNNMAMTQQSILELTDKMDAQTGLLERVADRLDRS